MAPDGPSKTILIAAANANDAAMLRSAIAKARLPHQLRFVSNSLQVIAYFEGKPPYTDRQTFPLPNVLLLDMTMPDHGGINVLRWLQAHALFGELPVVVFTGSDEDERTALALGADEFYVKPAIVDDFVRILENIHRTWLSPPL